MQPSDLALFSATSAHYNPSEFAHPLFGEALCLVTVSPVLAIVAYVAVSAAARDLHTAFALLGQLSGTAAVAALKRTVFAEVPRFSRPPEYVIALGMDPHESGMPSNHAQAAFFLFVYWSLVLQSPRRSTWNDFFHPVPRWAAQLVLGCWASAVAYSRAALHYHTAEQVLVELDWGSYSGFAWFRIVGEMLGAFDAALALACNAPERYGLSCWGLTPGPEVSHRVPPTSPAQTRALASQRGKEE